MTLFLLLSKSLDDCLTTPNSLVFLSDPLERNWNIMKAFNFAGSFIESVHVLARYIVNRCWKRMMPFIPEFLVGFWKFSA
jgi:hypothetical protein